MNKILTLVIVLLTLVFSFRSQAQMVETTRFGYDQVNFMGFDGTNIVGFHESNKGFIYNVINGIWTDFDLPEATNTRPWGIDGNTIVGINNNNSFAFMYDISTTTFTDITISSGTQPRDVSGDVIVGSAGVSMLIYNKVTSDPGNPATYTTLKHPSNATTRAWGIDGDNVVGEYGTSGFLYNITNNTWQTINKSGASRTNVQGISGNLVSGFYDLDGKSRGFVYNLTTDVWTEIPNPDPLSIFMQARSIEGNQVVGSYRPTTGNGDVGFIYTIPEPSSFLLLLSGLASLLITRRRA